MEIVKSCGFDAAGGVREINWNRFCFDANPARILTAVRAQTGPREK
jgi:hypothetical protein